MWICTKAVLCDGQESTQDYLKRRLLSIMQIVNRVCEEAFEKHEWVSELTISMQEEEIGVALNYRIDVPCVVQWCLLWFTAVSRLNQRIEGNGTKKREVPRGHKSGTCSHLHCLLSWIQHPASMHAEISRWGPGQSTRQRLERVQGDHWLRTG